MRLLPPPSPAFPDKLEKEQPVQSYPLSLPPVSPSEITPIGPSHHSLSDQSETGTACNTSQRVCVCIVALLFLYRLLRVYFNCKFFFLLFAQFFAHCWPNPPTARRDDRFSILSLLSTLLFTAVEKQSGEKSRAPPLPLSKSKGIKLFK